MYRWWLNKLINFSKGHNSSKTIIMKINCSKFILVLGLIIFCTKDVLLKVYDKCDLAQELLSKDEIVFNDVNTCKWFNLDNNFIIYFNWQTIMKQLCFKIRALHYWRWKFLQHNCLSYRQLGRKWWSRIVSGILEFINIWMNN